MSARRELERHLASLTEIRSIMTSMRALALVETRKLDRLMEGQQQLLGTIDRAARDLLHHHPDLLPVDRGLRTVTLLLGSERGFCGDFNEALVPGASGPEGEWLVVGRKLHTRIGEHPSVGATLPGPAAAEDVDGVLAQIVATISRIRQQQGAVRLVTHSHGRETGNAVRQRSLLPPWQAGEATDRTYRVAPVLNLSPRDMFRELVDHYLFAALRDILVASLWAENQRRAQHLDGAVSRLDERIGELQKRSRQVRQEEITEEIEVILLSTCSISGARPST